MKMMQAALIVNPTSSISRTLFLKNDSKNQAVNRRKKMRNRKEAMLSIFSAVLRLNAKRMKMKRMKMKKIIMKTPTLTKIGKGTRRKSRQLRIKKWQMNELKSNIKQINFMKLNKWKRT